MQDLAISDHRHQQMRPAVMAVAVAVAVHITQTTVATVELAAVES